MKRESVMGCRRLQDPVRLMPHLSVPTRDGARLADAIYERSKDTLSRLFQGAVDESLKYTPKVPSKYPR